MSKRVEKNLIVALDIGTSKIVALVGEPLDNGMVNVIGVGSHSSKGLKKGVVVNIETTVKSIQRAIEEAELMAGCQIHSAITGIAGSHIRSFNSHGIVAIHDHEVGQADIDRVLDAAKAVAIPADQQILHTIPQEFIIDSHEGIREPIGMSGVRLEAKVHMVTGAVSAAQNIIKCVRRCGLEVGDIVLQPLASSYAVLSDDEKELGVCMIDIGGGTTDIAIFTEGAIRHTAVIPIAGDQVTNDIAVALRTPAQNAEEIKKIHGSALVNLADPNDMIEVAGLSNRTMSPLSSRFLAEVIEPRYSELFTLIRGEIRRSGFENLISSGIVLTGGASKITGAVELAEAIFRMPVRLGVPTQVQGMTDVVSNPTYATGVGLLMYGQSHNDRTSEILVDNSVKGLWGRMKSWFQGNF